MSQFCHPPKTLLLGSSISSPFWQLQPGSTIPCAWSPDGTKLTLICQHDYLGTPGVKIINFNTHEVKDIQIDGEASLLNPYWSPDSQMLALKTYEPALSPNNVYIYDTSTLKQVMFMENTDFIAWLATP